MRQAPSWVSVLAVAMVAAGCAGSSIRPTVPEPVRPTPELLERGNYLVNSVAACGVCHTPRAGESWLGGERTDAFLGGGSVLRDEGAGLRIVAPNISQDRATGVGAWTDDQLVRAIRDGVSHDGRLMTPLMPFLAWQAMSDDDARAIVVYLRTTPAVERPISRAGDQIGFTTRMAIRMGAVHHRPARDVRAPNRADQRATGAYLAKVGLCWHCHSLGEGGPTDDADILMSGSRVPFEDPDYGKVYARNLTPDRETGLGGYSAEQIKRALRTGRRLDGLAMAPPMSLLIPHVSTWTDEDLDALIAYLAALPPISYRPPEPTLTPATRAIMMTAP